MQKRILCTSISRMSQSKLSLYVICGAIDKWLKIAFDKTDFRFLNDSVVSDTMK